jgi:site-specific DNA recombinase
MARRAVGYFREDAPGHEDGHTLADQERRFRDLCLAEGYLPGAVFVENAASADHHLAWRQLIDLLRGDATEVVVVIDTVDQLGDDARQAGRCYFQLVGLGASVQAALDPEGDPLAALVELWQGRAQKERIGERVRDAMRRKAVKGEVLGRPPYGYRAGMRHRLEVVPDEAAVVRYIFRMYNQDELGIRLIARRLNEEGYRTRRSGNWSMVTIRDILRNRVYLGTYSRFGVRVPGSHQALITADDFRKAQERMSARRTAGGPRTVTPFLLSGLAYCGACGNRMIGVSRRQSWTRRSDGGTSTAEYRYYQCGSRTNQSVCSYHTRRVEELDEAVRQAAVAALERNLAGEDQEQSDDNDLGDTARLRARHRNLDRELDKIMDRAAAGMMSGDRLRSLGIDIARRQLELETLLGQTERRTREREARVEQSAGRLAALEQLTSDWDNLSHDERQIVLRDALDRVTVHDDRVDVALRD